MGHNNLCYDGYTYFMGKHPVKCYLCPNQVTPCDGLQDIYCDDCKWDLHYSRQWRYKDVSKEEWKKYYKP